MTETSKAPAMDLPRLRGATTSFRSLDQAFRGATGAMASFANTGLVRYWADQEQKRVRRQSLIAMGMTRDQTEGEFLSGASTPLSAAQLQDAVTELIAAASPRVPQPLRTQTRTPAPLIGVRFRVCPDVVAAL